MPAFDGRCWTNDGRYYMRLPSGEVIRYSNWYSLECHAARALGITSYELYQLAARLYGGDGDRLPSGPGELANLGLALGLFRHTYPRLPCEGRQRRHTERTFTRWPHFIDAPRGEQP
jgi:hypothetical protein